MEAEGQPAVGGTRPLQVVLNCKRKLAQQAGQGHSFVAPDHHSFKASNQFLLLGSVHDCLLWN